MATPKKVKIEIVGNPGPSARGVESLFRDMRDRAWQYEERKEERSLKDELDKLKEAFEKTPAVQRIKKRLEVIEDRRHSRMHERKTALARVRARYHAYGLTPKVAREIQALLELFEKE